MKEVKNTIDGVKIVDQRRAGNSIRQVDAAIDYLFSGYKVEIRDHWENGNHPMANKSLFNSVLKRLHSEHGLDFLIENHKILIDHKNLTIELI